jgi:hypothetical protein
MEYALYAAALFAIGLLVSMVFCRAARLGCEDMDCDRL